VLDPATGIYNDAAVRRYGPSVPVALIQLAAREQGILVARGNPLGLRTVDDLARTGARYVNRQRDAGTRILFDSLLTAAGVPSSTIVGYDRLEFSHLAVAQLIANGNADAGLAIRAAAHAFDLDFVSVAWEPYELALPEAALDEPRMQLLIEILRDPAFRADVEALGGYDAARGGDVRVVMPAAAAAR
jgi:putative molybdopterin biosynthesis protein